VHYAAVDRIHRRPSVDSDAWCEDAHFAAIAVLYDIAIFNYSTTAQQWYSFNENATRGYICPLSLPGHMDVLHGFLEGSTPIIPPRVISQAASRENMNWQVDASLVLQQQFDFRYVWDWPFIFSGIEVLNCALVTAPQSAQNVTASEKPQQPQKSRTKETVYACSFSGCNFSGFSFIALQMHNIHCHSHKVCKDEGKQCATVPTRAHSFSDLKKDSEPIS